MGFKVGAYAKVWEYEKKGKYAEARISTSKKMEDKTYEADFSSRVRLIGKALNCEMKKGDTIKILGCEVTNSYDKEKKINYTNFVIWDCEQQGSNKGAATATSGDSVPF